MLSTWWMNELFGEKLCLLPRFQNTFELLVKRMSVIVDSDGKL